MKQSKTPLWKKSMLEKLNIDNIREALWEISDNGDYYGYDTDESGYYLDYKEQFDELSAAATDLIEVTKEYDLEENWDDIAVGLLGLDYSVFGYDSAEYDYYKMADPFYENLAIEEAKKRLKRLTKDELISVFGKVFRIVLLFMDVKASHDCLVSIVEELDNRGALLAQKNEQINMLYTDLTGKNAEAFDAFVANLPQRMWVE